MSETPLAVVFTWVPAHLYRFTLGFCLRLSNDRTKLKLRVRELERELRELRSG